MARVGRRKDDVGEAGTLDAFPDVGQFVLRMLAEQEDEPTRVAYKCFLEPLCSTSKSWAAFSPFLASNCPSTVSEKLKLESSERTDLVSLLRRNFLSHRPKCASKLMSAPMGAVLVRRWR